MASRMERESSLAMWERETIINFNEEEKVAHIYTHNKTWIAHLEKKLGVKPVAKNSHGGRDYEIPKKWIYKPHKPKTMNLSDEQKQATRDRLAAARKAQQQKKQVQKPKAKKSRSGGSTRIDSKL